MADKIAIDFDVLSYHAGRVEQVASDVAQAKSAAASIDLGGGAFGLMCAFLVPPIGLVSYAAQSALAAAQEMVERSAREIRAVGTDFEQLEISISDELSAASSELGGL